MTPRETEIMVAIATYGETGDQLARRFGVSPFTIRATKVRVFEELHVSSTVQAFIALGWLRPPSQIVEAGAEDI
jgi:DNA-binding CsgD family transcriptional regulator